MTVAVYLPLLLPALVSLIGWPAADRLRPAVAVRGLVAGAVVTAALSTWSLVLLASTLFDDVPPFRALGSRPGLHLPTPVHDAVAVLALGALVAAATGLGRDLRFRFDAVRRIRRAGVSPGFSAGDLVVADWDEPLAVAVPGHPGHVLVTSGMLRLLDPAERRAVLSHEQAHLDHRHHTAVCAVAAASAVNPLLRPARATVTYLVERWADEEAAVAVADRGLVARAVARAALASGDASLAPALGVHGGAILRRVSALRRPPATHGGSLLAGAAAATVAVCALAGGHATTGFIEVFRAWLRY